MIKPTVGRVLWFYPSVAWAAENDVAYGVPGEPLTALIAHVINDSMLNLSVFDQNGEQWAVTSVPLLEENVPLNDESMSSYAVWMPYQKGQDAKAEALENKLSGDTPTPAQCGHGFNDRAFVTRDLVMNMICQGKTAENIQHEVPILLELIFGVDPNKTECDRDPDISHAIASLSEQKRSAPVEAAPKLTDADIEAVIESKSYFTAADGVTSTGDSYYDALANVTFCVLILKNGYKITGVNHSSVSPENHNPEYGRELAYKDAKNKIWELEGYLLKQRLYEQQSGFQAIATEGT